MIKNTIDFFKLLYGVFKGVTAFWYKERGVIIF